MAEWPANGVTDWNTKMLAYLAIEHGTDGTHDVETMLVDGTGQYTYTKIDGTSTKIYTKYLTGTLGSSSPDTKAHGVSTALTKIYNVGVIVEDTNVGSLFNVPGARDGDRIGGGMEGFQITFDATNINIIYGGDLDGGKFRIKIDYIA